ncbi:MAG: glycine--tRNA ligase subunit beta [Rhodobacteraceae bacterium]|nr:glycine--tRNA ligase subunit beta [Paracoccaceae bacterium]
MPDLLIELRSEEIPARMQPRAREDLLRLVTRGLAEAGLGHGSARAFVTPRRLALAVADLAAASPPVREERKGPRTDAPEAAIAGFLRATGVAREALVVQRAGKGEVLVAVIERPGRPAAAIVAEVLERTVRDFPWPKAMRWGAGSATEGALRWVRPLQSILCILAGAGGAEVVAVTIGGIAAGATTAGHPVMAPAPFAVTGPRDYAARLRAARVMLDAEERMAVIGAEADRLARARGLEIVPDACLLQEIAGLVEWPVVLMGAVAPAFLDLPAEVLQTSMREHQKFLSARNPATGRIEGFVTVANRETADAGATILGGNARVLAARLSDARFFWDNDLRTVRDRGLEGMAAGLREVAFHGPLGSQWDRVRRLETLARELAPAVGAPPDLAAEAARVAKADLRSAMVGEFPELQGIMGARYATAAGLPPAVASACREHYLPQGPGDDVPSAPVSVALALADRLDTLAAFWAIDERPTGSKDPFALRRAALGVIRLLIANGVRLGLRDLLAARIGALAGRGGRDGPPAAPPAPPGAAADSLLAFLHDRLKVHLREQGMRHDVIDACTALAGSDDLALLVRRATALAAFLATDDGENLVQGFRRAANLLAQAEARDGVEYSFGPDPSLARDPAETRLFAALDAARAAFVPALAAEDFAAAMAALAGLRAPIDAFLEAVQVNADNALLRRNRLNLLHRIRETCRSVADLSRLEG